MKQIMWDQENGRLRVGWRLIGHFIILFILLIPLSICAVSIAVLVLLSRGENVEGFLVDPANTLLLDPVIAAPFTLFTCIAFVVTIWIAGRFLDRRRFSDFGLHLNGRFWADFGFGLALGAILMAFIFVVELVFGWIEVTGTWLRPNPNTPFIIAIIPAIITFLSVGIYEELYFRGYLMKNLAEGFSFLSPKTAVLIALIISSLIFGIAHGGNPNATLISTFNLVLAGFFLAVGYMLTGELAIPIGLHITWNFFQGHVFGFPVSGQPTQTTIIAIQQGGDDLLAGGAFGPEAGMISLIAMILGTILIAGWVRWRYGRIQIHTQLTKPDLVIHKNHVE